MPTTFDLADQRFNYRVAAVLLREDEVLLHRLEGDEFWTLPGGRPEIGEASAAALVRELSEELAIAARVERLLWISESFFEHARRRWHELSLIFLCRLPDGCPPLLASRPFCGQEPDRRLQFEWRRIDDLPQVALYPAFLAEGLRNLPVVPTQIVDDRESPRPKS